MSFSSLMRTLQPPWARPGRQTPRQALRRRSVRLTLEQLEDRMVPSNFTAATVSDLIADINAANQAGGSNTITLVTGTTFQLTAVDNTTDGATGLPVIAANNNLTILGNGDVIERSTGAGTPAFRLLDVAGGASLTLANLTLQGGLAWESFAGVGPGVPAEGGAIFNQGTLSLSGVTVQQNVAQGYFYRVVGGGIYSNGALTLQSCTIQNNQALGFDGLSIGSSGGSAFGGGVAITGGTANLTNVALVSNTAQGGDGGHGRSTFLSRGSGGKALGGGIFVGGGSVILVGTAVNHNTATGGNGNIKGEGLGGGIYIDVAAMVALDAFTQANVKHNSASTSDPNIHGSFSTYP